MHAQPKLNAGEFDRRWRRVLLAFFARRIGERSEAEDLTQEVFERLLRSDEALAHPDAYVFQIAMNLLADRKRRQRVRDRHQQFVEAEERRDIEFLDPHTIATGRDRVERLIKALESLPERARAIFVLYKFENLGQDVIADQYGITKSAVKKQIAKALAHVATQMGEG